MFYRGNWCNLQMHFRQPITTRTLTLIGLQGIITMSIMCIVIRELLTPTRLRLITLIKKGSQKSLNVRIASRLILIRIMTVAAARLRTVILR